MQNLYDRLVEDFESTFYKHGENYKGSSSPREYVENQLESMSREEFLEELSIHLEDMFNDFKQEMDYTVRFWRASKCSN